VPVFTRDNVVEECHDCWAVRDASAALLLCVYAVWWATVPTGGSHLQTQTPRSSGPSRTTGACGSGTTHPWASVSIQHPRQGSLWLLMHHSSTGQATPIGGGWLERAGCRVGFWVCLGGLQQGLGWVWLAGVCGVQGLGWVRFEVGDSLGHAAA
jgi:hypothetical protein